MRRFRPLFALISVATVVVACGSDGSETGSGPGGVSAGGASGSAGTSSGGTSGKGGASGGSGKGGASGANGKAGSSTGGSAAGESGKGGGSGQSPAGAAGGPVGGCSADTDCPALATIPAGCAAPTCDKKTNKCVYASKDADGDTFPSGRCAALDGVTSIVIGEDCDDTNPDVNPGGWDGPAGDGNPNGCGDGLDQNCSGVDDDQKLADGTTCTCAPGDTQDCSLDASGKPVVFPGGKPRGICAYGQQTCVDSGKWGPCVDTIAPNVEVCDPSSSEDEDCDGLKDDADPDVLGKKTWFCDVDSDSFLAPNVVGIESCQQPPKDQCAGKWVTSGQKTDCDDSNGKTYPGAQEICDEVRNDCDATKQPDEGATAEATWFWDGDGDRYVADSEIAAAKKSCANPGRLAENCRGAAAPCLDRWVSSGAQKAGSDCNDGDPATFPGAWDGPAGVAYGIDADGLAMKVYQTPAGAAPPLGPDGVPYPKDVLLAEKREKTLSLDWGQRGPFSGAPGSFAAALSGTIVAPESGTYTFRVPTLMSSLHLEVGATTVVNMAGATFDGGAQAVGGSVEMLAGVETPFLLEMVEAGTGSGVVLEWSGPGVPWQVLTARSPASLVGQPNRCDGVLQNCLAAEADASTGGNRTCAGECFPANVGLCGVTVAQATAPSTTCVLGSRACTTLGRWATCQGAQGPVAETCDGKDNDCDGEIDEGDPEGGAGCSTGKPGVCAPGFYHCIGGAKVCVQTTNPSAEVCDGLDNNCDGFVDNNPNASASYTLAMSCVDAATGSCLGTAMCGIGGSPVGCTAKNACPAHWTPQGGRCRVAETNQAVWRQTVRAAGDGITGVPFGSEYGVTDDLMVHVSYAQTGAQCNVSTSFDIRIGCSKSGVMVYYWDVANFDFAVSRDATHYCPAGTTGLSVYTKVATPASDCVRTLKVTGLDAPYNCQF